MSTSGSRGLQDAVLRAVLVASSLIFFYTAGFGQFSATTQRALHWTFMSSALFLTYRTRPRGRETGLSAAWDGMWLLLAVVTGLYILLTWSSRTLKVGDAPTMDIIVGIAAVLVVFEATRRATGYFLATTAAVFLAYALYGPYFPGWLGHRGISFSRMISFLCFTTEGIFGIPLGISSTYIVVFVLFGSFLEKFGGGQWFVDMSYAVAGRYRGGPAKTSVISSALMGMLSGAPVANVVTTGTFTIPLMKKVGYKPWVAGAVEAVASTGGMFTPPVMGAGAFIMAEYLGTTYSKVAIAAAVPAFLYYYALMLAVDAHAVRGGLKGLPGSELPSVRRTMADRGHLAIPLIFLISAILLGWSPMKAAFWASILTIAVAFLKANTRPNLSAFLKALESGSREVVPIAAACAAAGIIVGSISITGLGPKISSSLMELSRGNVMLALSFTALATLILGCAMPPTAVYIIVVAILAQPLQSMGLMPIAVHLFIFIFASVAALTPPVAITAYAGAGIAGADPNRTGFTAFRLGLSAYIIPFMFATAPALIMQGDVSAVAAAVLTALFGVSCLVAAVEGFLMCKWYTLPRVLLGTAALLLIRPGLRTDLVGLALVASAVALNMASTRGVGIPRSG
ncbi:MAG: TRAP transporter permease [Firmicutes bacterium]|jgi:TRAP transporter 4TM/12TM fusion protein|nr:TRAP transporter permease [Bacillota bacterium]